MPTKSRPAVEPASARRRVSMTRCNSGADGKVRMGEGVRAAVAEDGTDRSLRATEMSTSLGGYAFRAFLCPAVRASPWDFPPSDVVDGRLAHQSPAACRGRALWRGQRDVRPPAFGRRSAGGPDTARRGA